MGCTPIGQASARLAGGAGPKQLLIDHDAIARRAGAAVPQPRDEATQEGLILDGLHDVKALLPDNEVVEAVFHLVHPLLRLLRRGVGGTRASEPEIESQRVARVYVNTNRFSEGDTCVSVHESQSGREGSRLDHDEVLVKHGRQFIPLEKDRVAQLLQLLSVRDAFEDGEVVDELSAQRPRGDDCCARTTEPLALPDELVHSNV